MVVGEKLSFVFVAVIDSNASKPCLGKVLVSTDDHDDNDGMGVSRVGAKTGAFCMGGNVFSFD